MATSTLDLSSIVPNTPLKVRGFVGLSARRPPPMISARIALVDVTNAPATLVVGWPLLEATPFNKLSGRRIGRQSPSHRPARRFPQRLSTHHCRRETHRPCRRSIRPAACSSIGDNGTVQVYTRLSAYQAALAGGPLRPDARRGASSLPAEPMSMPRRR